MLLLWEHPFDAGGPVFLSPACACAGVWRWEETAGTPACRVRATRRRLRAFTAPSVWCVPATIPRGKAGPLVSAAPHQASSAAAA